MLVIYNSPHYLVTEFKAHENDVRTGGYEIMDKQARRETFIDGVVAAQFRQSVQELMQNEPTAEEIDEFLGRFDSLMHHPVVLH